MDRVAESSADALHLRTPDRETGPPVQDHASEAARSGATAGHRVWLADAGAGLPAQNGDRTIRAAVRGCVSNRDDLRRELHGAGHRFESDDDAELIAHAYEAWGERAAERLQGTCSFVVIDDRRHRVFAVRDRMGVTSVCYAQDASGLAIASHPSRIEYLLGRPLELEPSSLAYVLSLGYVPAPRSIWRGVQRLRPGHSLRWSPEAAPRVRAYWDPVERSGGVEPDPEDWWAEFDRTVADHVRDDRPLGLLFSGGYDSTALALAMRRAGREVHPVTAGSPLCRVDEGEAAAAVAKHLGMTGRRVIAGERPVDSLLSCAGECEEPRAHRAVVSTFVLAEATANGYDILISGHGTEAVFDWAPFGSPREAVNGCGSGAPPRNRFGRMLRRARTGRAVRRLRRAGRGGRRASAAAGVAARAELERFASRSQVHARMRRLCPFFLPGEVERILAPLGVRFEEESTLEPWSVSSSGSNGDGSGSDGLQRTRALRRATVLGFYADLMLGAYEDAGRQGTLEIRFPYVAPGLVERAMSYERQPERTGWFLHYLDGEVPPYLMDRPKAGFELERLWDFDWRTAVERIRRGPWVRNGLWGPEWERLIAPGMPDRRWRVSNLLLLTYWAERRLP